MQQAGPQLASERLNLQPAGFFVFLDEDAESIDNGLVRHYAARCLELV